MKLLKKLIPVATVASAVAAVTPLMVSCGAKTYTFDGSEIYIPDAEMAKAAEGKNFYSDGEALQLYFDDLNKDPDIFKEDMYYYISKHIFEVMHDKDIMMYDDAKFEASISYSNIKVNVDEKRLSYRVKGSLIFNLPLYYYDDEIMYCNIDSFSFDVQNLPYYCSANVGYDWFAWEICPAVDLLLEDSNVSFTAKMKGIVVTPSYTVKLDGNKYVVNSETKKEDINLELIAITAFFGEYLSGTYESYHMNRIFPDYY